MPTPSKFRESLAAGTPVFGARVASYAPSLVEVYGSLGLDYVRVDLERPGPSPWDGRYLENIARAARGADIELLVRLPNADPSLVRRVLDTGVRNLMRSSLIV
jgi:2-dehydro-3-deoxyglucarate aldolase